jgi:hypothetical protein
MPEQYPDMDKYWPSALDHLQAPYDDRASDYVTIAETNEAPYNGFNGATHIRTALVPLSLVEEILATRGGIGHEVKSWGPHPTVRAGQIYETSFWIDGRKGKKEHFQTIINSWSHHDREVLLPDNVLLMTYGLVPRYLVDSTVCWDDPHGPVYEVLRVKPHINHSDKNTRAFAQIMIRREYLEDYCHLKSCAAVAVYYEERFSSDDNTFTAVLNGVEGMQFELPGRTLGLSTQKGSFHGAAPQMSRVWGARLILKPLDRPISDAKDPILTWPGDTEPMTAKRAAASFAYAHVRDDVLKEYESRPEFQIRPESGGVNYGGWWGTDRTQRIGRNHIRIELKRFYEGCPPQVLALWHRFSVSEAVAENDRNIHGNRNIATRAKTLVTSFLALTTALEHLSDQLDVGLTQEDLGTLTSGDIAYRGWWAPNVCSLLCAVAPLAATREQFLERSVSMFKLLELLKQAPLRTLALHLGVPKDKLKDLGALKLLACICQLAAIANAAGYSLVEEAESVIAGWNAHEELPEFRSLFALNGLRVCQAHTPGNEREAKIGAAAERLGVDIAAMATGWGYAIDAMYDRVAYDLASIARSIESIK